MPSKSTYNFCVALSATMLELLYPLMTRSVPVQSVAHFTISAVLLEHVFFFKLLLLGHHDSRQLEQEPAKQFDVKMAFNNVRRADYIVHD